MPRAPANVPMPSAVASGIGGIQVAEHDVVHARVRRQPEQLDERHERQHEGAGHRGARDEPAVCAAEPADAHQAVDRGAERRAAKG